MTNDMHATPVGTQLRATATNKVYAQGTVLTVLADDEGDVFVLYTAKGRGESREYLCYFAPTDFEIL